MEGGGGHLHGAEEGDVVEVVEAELPHSHLLFFHDEGVVLFGYVVAGGVEVESAGFGVGGDEAAHVFARPQGGRLGFRARWRRVRR